MSVAAKDLLSANAANDEYSQVSPAEDIEDRLSQEIVIAFVGPVGSGVTTTANKARDILTGRFKYEVPDIITLSDFIKMESHRTGIPTCSNDPIDVYIQKMQTAGNKLREKFGNRYLAEKAVEQIVKIRRSSKGYAIVGGRDIPIPGRRAYIIDSIKNPDELNLLRQIYRETLIIIGVFAPDKIRKKRLEASGADSSNVSAIVNRDQGEVATWGQKTRKVFVSADFFIRNDSKLEDIERRLNRYFDIVFDTGIHTPMRAESAMYEATAAAAKSACMSRQVGAAIVSERGEMIAIGWNDVPKYGGGLYNEDDQNVASASKTTFIDNDKRCFKHRGGICHNETRRKSIINKVASKLKEDRFLKSGIGVEKVITSLAGTDVDSIIEYSRSIHAEMEAILSVAREGKHSLLGSTLYTTTYPCHNCARHIVAAGIKEVIYIEPYLKSLAIELHEDAITEDADEPGKVVFRQFDGVAPHSYLRLFRPIADRKKDGRLSREAPGNALPIFRVPLDGFVDYEAKVVADLELKEQDGEPT